MQSFISISYLWYVNLLLNGYCQKTASSNQIFIYIYTTVWSFPQREHDLSIALFFIFPQCFFILRTESLRVLHLESRHAGYLKFRQTVFSFYKNWTIFGVSLLQLAFYSQNVPLLNCWLFQKCTLETSMLAVCLSRCFVLVQRPLSL